MANCGCSTASCTVSARFCSPPENSSFTPRFKQLGANAERRSFRGDAFVDAVGRVATGAQ